MDKSKKLISKKQRTAAKYTQNSLFDFEPLNPGESFAKSEADDANSQSIIPVQTKSSHIRARKSSNSNNYSVPEEVLDLMARLLVSEEDARQEATIYDPYCGSGLSLMAVVQHFEENQFETLRIYGQDPRTDLCMQAKETLSLLNFITDIQEGNALQNPKFMAEDNTPMRFGYIIANFPWNLQPCNEDFAVYKKRFKYGIPTRFTDWGWIQHILASLEEHGRAVILTSMGAITRGIYNDSDVEHKIRNEIINRDYIEAAIRLPDNLFENIPFPSIILLLNCSKCLEHQGRILEVDASQLFRKEGSRKKLTEEGINTIYSAYNEWVTSEGFSKIITIQEAQKKFFNLNPSVYNKVVLPIKPPEEIRLVLESVQGEHGRVYREIKTHQNFITSVASPHQSNTVAQDILDRLAQTTSPSIFLPHIRRLQSLVHQEIVLEEDYKQSLMHNFFTDPIWPTRKLGNITAVSSGGNPLSKDKELYGDEFYWVQLQDLNNGTIRSTAKRLSRKGVLTILPKAELARISRSDIVDNATIEKVLRKVDTVVVAKINGCEPQGKLGILGVPAATNVEVCCIDPQPEELLPSYLIYYIKYIRHTWADYASQTRKEPRINNALIKDTQITLPPLKKQEEIVAILGTRDTNISKLMSEKRKIDKLLSIFKKP